MPENSVSEKQAQNQVEKEAASDTEATQTTQTKPEATQTTMDEHYVRPTTREAIRLRNKALETAKEALKARVGEVVKIPRTDKEKRMEARIPILEQATDDALKIDPSVSFWEISNKLNGLINYADGTTVPPPLKKDFEDLERENGEEKPKIEAPKPDELPPPPEDSSGYNKLVAKRIINLQDGQAQTQKDIAEIKQILTAQAKQPNGRTAPPPDEPPDDEELNLGRAPPPRRKTAPVVEEYSESDRMIVPYDTTVEKVAVPSKFRTFFSTWKARKGYEGNLADFFLDVFEEWFGNRHADLIYIEQDSALPPNFGKPHPQPQQQQGVWVETQPGHLIWKPLSQGGN